MVLKAVIWGLLLPFAGTAAGAACVFFAVGFSLMMALDVALG